MSLLHRAVLASRGWPGLSSLYRAAYLGAASASARALGSVEGVDAVILHRGLASAGWEPGVSDIDLIVTRASGADEDRFLECLGAKLGRLRRLAPMLGDLWIGDPSELESYRRWGGLRAWEDSPSWRPLVGGLGACAPCAESALKRRRLDPWVWAFVAHMELGRRVFGAASRVAAKDHADCRKLWLDVARLCEFAQAPAAGTARPRARAALVEERAVAARLGPRELWIDGSLRLARASTAVLAEVRSPSSAAAGFPRPERGGEPDSLLRALLSAAPRAAAAYLDPPYHAYLLLPEGASKADYASAADAFASVKPAGVPLALEPAAWALCLQSSYLGAPLGRLGAEAEAPAGGLFGDWRAAGLERTALEAPLLPAELAWETAAEAASWMALWWRYLWIAPGWDNRFVLFHLYTRALGLRLALDGAPTGPWSDWRGSAERCARRFPDDAAFFESFERFCLEEPRRCVEGTDRSLLAPEHLAALAGLIGAFQGKLAAREAECFPA